MDTQHQQAAERIKQANNILVTVSNNPSVDQLAACIGLTLTLNKMGKHATAVFSGAIPSTLEFLQPNKTIEKNTDSLRDFIIALDKSKADKLRYKVEDRVVKIFITPYRTSISDKDLEFSQGDFNVDVVVALGVHSQAELDQAITVHGRILHDATIITMNVKPGGELGGVNWLDPAASSLSELAVELADSLDKKVIDGQIATAFLTGIVAETERFSNGKTTPRTMSISAELMGEGANQQLVATKLEEPVTPQASAPIANQEPHGDEAPPIKKSEDGTLEIAHDAAPDSKEPEKPIAPPTLATPELTLPGPQDQPVTSPALKLDAMPLPPTQNLPDEPAPQIQISEHGELTSPLNDPKVDDDEDLLPPLPPQEPPAISRHNERLVVSPQPTANTVDSEEPAPSGNPFEPPKDEIGLLGMPPQPTASPTMNQPTDTAALPTTELENAPGTTFIGDQPIVPAEKPANDVGRKMPEPGETLSQIEQDVNSKHLIEQPQQPLPSPLSPVSPSFAAPAPPSPFGSTPSAAPSINPNLFAPSTQSQSPLVQTFSPSVTNTPLPDSTPPTAAVPADDLDVTAFPTLDSARDAVSQAINGTPVSEADPLAAVDDKLHEEPSSTDDLGFAPATPAVQPWSPPADNSSPSANSVPLGAGTPPPIGPPPMMPPGSVS